MSTLGDVISAGTFTSMPQDELAQLQYKLGENDDDDESFDDLLALSGTTKPQVKYGGSDFPVHDLEAEMMINDSALETELDFEHIKQTEDTNDYSYDLNSEVMSCKDAKNEQSGIAILFVNRLKSKLLYIDLYCLEAPVLEEYIQTKPKIIAPDKTEGKQIQSLNKKK